MSRDDRRETKVAVGVNVCVCCGETWKYRIYPWWGVKQDYLYCSSCAAKRWYDEQMEAWRSQRRFVRK